MIQLSLWARGVLASYTPPRADFLLLYAKSGSSLGSDMPGVSDLAGEHMTQIGNNVDLLLRTRNIETVTLTYHTGEHV